jgi:hypothetical protein
MSSTGKSFAAISALLFSACLMPRAALAEAVSFRNDVMAVLSKAGCNAGPCHGNQNGKAGFKLSLRGEDAESDWKALTRDMFSRRVDPNDPEQSLVLLKATTQLAHEGGLRFRKDSEEYALLLNWIAGGAPDDATSAPRLERIEVSPAEITLTEPASEVAVRPVAFFSNGTRRNLEQLAVFEPANGVVKVTHDGVVQRESFGESTVLVRYLDQQVPVRIAFIPARPDFTWSKARPNNSIDVHIFAKLRAMRMNASGICSDTEFVRRAYLDLLGILPTAGEAQAFVNLSSQGNGDMSGSIPRRAKGDAGFAASSKQVQARRARLVEELLQRPEFADFWALKWSDVLRNEEKVLDRKGIQLFHDWIRQSLAQNKPVDQFVREILSARGSTYLYPAANFYRANRDATTRSEAVAQLFLGARLQCAKCHNHPYDKWTQADYYDWADVFARVQYKVLENHRRDALDTHEFIGEQIVYWARDGDVINPRTGKPAQARFLGEQTGVRRENPRATAARSATRPEPENDTMPALAVWLTSHPNFARAQVNWVWFHLMGRGLVDPIDDFRPTNPPSHPALLDALAKDFAAHHFDLRYLIRAIMTSRTYQLSTEPNDTNRDDEANFSHALTRRLSAEQLLDAQHQVLGLPAKFQGYPAGFRAVQLPGGSPVRRNEVKMAGPEKFLATFGKPARLLACECERSSETTLGQTFQLINSPELNRLLADPKNRLTTLLQSSRPVADRVSELYWTALSRAPSENELRDAVKLLKEAPDKRAALEDITWALLNAKEFILRH